MKRSAVTLIEIVMALTICTAAIVVVQWSGTGSVVQTQRAAAQSRELAAALRAARETAIGSGQSVRLRFISATDPSFGRGTGGFVLEKTIDNANYVPLAVGTRFPAQLVGQSNVMQITFGPTGDADSSLNHLFDAGGQTFLVSVDRVGGRAHYVKQ